MQNKEFTGFTEVGMVLKGAQMIQSLPHHRAAHPPMSDVGCKPGPCTSIHQLQTAWGSLLPRNLGEEPELLDSGFCNF